MASTYLHCLSLLKKTFGITIYMYDYTELPVEMPLNVRTKISGLILKRFVTLLPQRYVALHLSTLIKFCVFDFGANA